ncbi:MAG: sulfite exporter TauE/SafE family protein [Alphaproteobacteria bacterium]|nr:sulfite exporter TauE/SafE family protein [Alphaproteobacteria bacterium]
MSNLSICHNEIIMQGGFLSSLFMAGAVGSMTHCTGMCGPFVMSFAPQAANGSQQSKLSRLSNELLLPYHLGRVTTYILLGITAALFSQQAVQLSQSPIIANTLPAILLALGGVLFLLQFLGISGLKIDMPSLPRAMQQTISRLSQNPTGLRGYAMGLILGFLPCGLLLSAVLIAAAAPNWWSAGAGMALFGVSTIPALNAVAFIKNQIASSHPSWMTGLRKGLTLANSLALFFLAGVRLI